MSKRTRAMEAEAGTGADPEFKPAPQPSDEARARVARALGAEAGAGADGAAVPTAAPKAKSAKAKAAVDEPRMIIVRKSDNRRRWIYAVDFPYFELQGWETAPVK